MPAIDMNSRDFKPPEEKTSAIPFFLLGTIFVLITAWTVWDEAFTRRPWKNYQNAFNQYEKEIVQNQLSKKQTELKNPLTKIDSEINSLEEKVRNDKVLNKLKQTLKEKNLKAFEKGQEYGFAKAIYDETFFTYEEALRKGKDISLLKSKLVAEAKKIGNLKPIAEKAEKERDQVKAKIDSKLNPLKLLQKRKREIAKEISSLQRRIDSINSRKYEIKQLVLRGFDKNNFNEPTMRVDRCQSCHLAIDRKGFENAKHPFRTHPNRKFYLKSTHNMNKIGCTSCHGGQGAAVTSVDKAHGFVQFWEDPLLKGQETETKCRNCHTEVFNIPKAPHISQGISLIRELGCHGCHLIPGTKDIRMVGPNLTRIQEKVQPDWLVSWIKRPKDYNPRTKMPYYGFSQKESEDIASYIWYNGKRKIQKEKISSIGSSVQIQKGKKLFETVGCLSCHVRDKKDILSKKPIKGVNGRTIVFSNRDFGPALHKLSEKVQTDWLYRWVRNPKAYWHDTKMPSLRLTKSESEAITSYLLSLTPKKKKKNYTLSSDAATIKRGKNLVSKNGCYGCHVIPGTEKLSKIGPNLSRFATKSPVELSYGNVLDIPHTWEAWSFSKLKNPKIFQTEREKLLMPNFGLSDKEVTQIRTYLRSMTPHGAPHNLHHHLNKRQTKVEAGRRMLEKYNCQGCHVIENWGGKILKRYKDKNNAPPYLNGEGKKVQPNWFYGFLNNVVTLRPWLKIRMPSFQMPNEDSTKLVEYFAALDNKMRPYIHFSPKSTTKQLSEGKELFNKAECVSCHGEWPPPEGKEPPSAPNLNLAKKRLRPTWIVQWLKNPQEILPGTKMPTFWPESGISSQIISGKFQEKEDGNWIYKLESDKESDLPEEYATLHLKRKTIRVKVLEVDEKSIRISSPEKISGKFSNVKIISHGEPIDSEILGGDALEQMRVLRDYLMIKTNLSNNINKMRKG
ncbi:MAG: c-type cytochrome [Nitrospinota bacterium]|nr:c-type cytochrome [Nitrospinota bacterium]